MILVTSTERPFSDPYRSDFLDILGRITNTLPSVIESRVITIDEVVSLSEKHPVNLNIVYAQGEDPL